MVGDRFRAAVKRRILPATPSPRKVPFGIARGIPFFVDAQSSSLRSHLGLYEIELNPWLRRLGGPGVRAFDLGGQSGYDSLVLARLGCERVVCVEADADCCEAIKRNLALSPTLEGRITVIHACVDNHVDSRELKVTVDALAATYFQPDLLKIDIEGFESAALEGARRCLGERHPSMIIEVHSWEQETRCREILREFSYALEAVDPRRWVPDYRPIEHNRWLIAQGTKRI